ncbi:MAG TPA: LysR family transcriptional regulator [Sphingobium sp.]|nr:LysR family transcriptional regulator [Sphingobium sp.]
MHWDDLRYFLAVERNRTLSRAAARLGVDATTVGRRIERLGQDLNATLFEVGPFGHSLTLAGEKLLQHAEEVERSVLAASGDVTGESSRLAGTVRISLSEGLANWIFTPNLPSFQARHPGIMLEIATTNGFLNPSKREADMAVMLARPTHGALITQKLTDYRLGLFASQGYIAAHGMVEDLADLRQRTLIGYIPDLIYADELRYLEEIDPALKPRLTSSSINMQHAMTKAGLGVAVLPLFMGMSDPGMVPLLPDLRINGSYWIVVHADLRHVARVNAVIEWLRAVASDVDDQKR